jgi:DNA polymerase-1
MYLQLDYSQVELRVLAMLSGDPWFTQVFIDGRDLHTEVALAMFGPDFTKPQRVLAKTINFGIAYGRGPQSIADKFGIPLYQAKKMIEDWYKPVPLIRKWLNDQRKSPYKGNDCITPFGRHRHFTITYENRNHVENESCNTPIQSCASDFTMLSMLRIDEHLVKHNIDAKLVMTIHDSIVLEIKDDPDLIEETVEVCLNIMRTTPELYLGPQKVPFEAEAEVGPDWGSLMPWHKCECGKWIKTVKDKMFTCLSCGRQYAK